MGHEHLSVISAEPAGKPACERLIQDFSARESRHVAL